MELHVLTLASHSYALLAIPRKSEYHMASFFQFPYVRECAQTLGSTDGNKPCCLSYRHLWSTSCDRLGNLKRAVTQIHPLHDDDTSVYEKVTDSLLNLGAKFI